MSVTQDEPPAGDELAGMVPSSSIADEIRQAPPLVAPLRPLPDPPIVRARRGIYVDLFKPVLEWLAALVLVVLTAPLIAAILVVARLRLGRGVILRQERVGRHGRTFGMYKIRTMDPDRRSGRDRRGGSRDSAGDRRQSHKRADDPRHTSVGRVMRRYSLDELPQLWNVLRGEMALVGPRPELVEIVRRLDLWDHPRHLVRPGITGLWQVSVYRDQLLHENLFVDIDYVRTRSLRVDLAILAATMNSVGDGSGA